MVILTHHAFPFPIWGALQIRNRAVLHRTFARNDALELHAAIGALRGLGKGTEVDLTLTARAAGELVWECITTFYYRGIRRGESGPSALPVAPVVESPVTDRWVAPVAERWRFGQLTGDYNGIHQWRWYARLFGFRNAFQHPQRALGQCLAHLPRRYGDAPLRLDTWLKGPVFYGADLSLRVSEADDSATFALQVDQEARPAIVGRLTSASASIG